MGGGDGETPASIKSLERFNRATQCRECKVKAVNRRGDKLRTIYIMTTYQFTRPSGVVVNMVGASYSPGRWFDSDKGTYFSGRLSVIGALRAI